MEGPASRPAPPERFYIFFFLGFFTRLFGQGTDAPSRKKKFNTYIAGRLCPTTDDRRRRASLLFLAPERWDVSKRKIKRSYKLRGFYNFRSGRIRSTESTPLDEIDIVPRSSPPPPRSFTLVLIPPPARCLYVYRGAVVPDDR